MSSGVLFPNLAKTEFLDITRGRYHSMAKRIADDFKVALPFTLAQLRQHVLDHMKDRYDGAITCQYCRVVCSLKDAALDHAVPISRGGGLGLDNIDIPCDPCNRQKGADMTPAQFHAFLLFLEGPEMALARPGILLRLQMHSKLIAGKRMNEFTIRELKASGQWPKKEKKVKGPLQAAMDDAF